jgi:PhnB protein
MPERSMSDRLERALSGRRPAQEVDPALRPLLEIAGELRALPREDFKARLKFQLERKAIMASQTQALSATTQTATARLRVKNAPAAIEFYKKAFGAAELMRFEAGGSIAHAELAIGNTIITLGEEALEYGFPSAETMGGSPVAFTLNVDDADAWMARALAAGAKLLAPVRDQFYGNREGRVADPFGYAWTISTHLRDMSREEMHRALEQEEQPRRAIPAGYRTVTPYIVVQDAPALIGFVAQVFGGEEKFRAIGSAGGIHAEVKMGDSMLMMGGGAPDLAWKGQTWPTALHIYVPDTDAAFERALAAGGVELHAPEDHDYGERGASVRDPWGNHWYIATAKGGHYQREGWGTVIPYLHPLRADPLISFLKRAFGATEIARYASPDGVIQHAEVRVNDSIVEMGEAHGPYPFMPTMFYLYVPDVDAAYRRALSAGAASEQEPADQSYGDRVAAVKDAFGNLWYMGTPLEKRG